jgi:hypothetical protein
LFTKGALLFLNFAKNKEQVVESLLHFIWNYKLLKPVELLSVNGSKIRILHPGELNKDSGPDFFNARLEVDGVTLAGNIEIHVNSSDWLRHDHQNDPSYNNLVLHVVYKHDKLIEQNREHNVEVLELKDYVDPSILVKYESLVSSDYTLACSGQISTVDGLKLRSWLQRMLIERLENKVQVIRNIFEVCGNDHAQTFYLLLARNFGFKVNSEPFELLAKHLPLHILMKHASSLFQLEALLYGCAGFLNEQYEHKYPQQLQNEFEFLKTKYKLKEIDPNLWKFLRLRPANFPTVRIWQFAMLMHKCPDLFSKPETFCSVKELSEAVSYDHEGYWKDHYRFDSPPISTLGGLGKGSIENIVINTLAPFLFFFGKQTGRDQLLESALELFDSVPFENNLKTRVFLDAGLILKTASDSQGLINLFDNYCKTRSCLKCSVASNLLTNR